MILFALRIHNNYLIDASPDTSFKLSTLSPVIMHLNSTLSSFDAQKALQRFIIVLLNSPSEERIQAEQHLLHLCRVRHSLEKSDIYSYLFKYLVDNATYDKQKWSFLHERLTEALVMTSSSPQS